MYLDEKYHIKKMIIELLGTIIGAAIMAVGVSLFLLPNQLSSGRICWNCNNNLLFIKNSNGKHNFIFKYTIAYFSNDKIREKFFY